ncbi:MAG: protein-L-isoaspartate O-methyltransferase family protein [Candidatus Tyrphobacter sp.]
MSAQDVRLRYAMVTEMRRVGTLQDRAVIDAFASVARHLFVPHVPPSEAYLDRAISIKSEGGETIASISQPSMLARMLELAAIEPGNGVLEIGTGSGYNAALAARIAGRRGRVVTLEIEPDLARAARSALEAAGCETVEVVVGDGHLGHEAGGSYDRIIVSARASDIADAWWEQLRDGGRIVIPLDIGAGGEYAVAFVREGSLFRSTGIVQCLFVPLRGEQRPSPEAIFARSPSARYGDRPRRIAEISAVKTAQAQPEILERADIVVAQPCTTFAIVWG